MSFSSSQTVDYHSRISALHHAAGPVPRPLLQSVLELLGHPDSAVRDDGAFSTLQEVIVDGAADEHIPWMVDYLLGPSGLTCREETADTVPVLARSFSLLVLACLVYRSRTELLTAVDVPRVIHAVVELLSREERLDSWNDRFGWIHLLAHAADLVDELCEAGITADEAASLIGALREVMLRKRRALFSFGEYDRLAYAITTAVANQLFDGGAWNRIFQPTVVAAEEFDRPPETVVRANHMRQVVRALYWQAERRMPGSPWLETMRGVNRVFTR